MLYSLATSISKTPDYEVTGVSTIMEAGQSNNTCVTRKLSNLMSLAKTWMFLYVLPALLVPNKYI